MRGYNIHNPAQITKLASDERGLRNWCKNTSADFYGAFTYGDAPCEFWVDGRLYKSRAAADTAAASQLAVEARG
jgi:hypothetical protein